MIHTIEKLNSDIDSGKQFNPYWVCWIMQTGGGRTHEFIVWIRSKWMEFEPNERKHPELKKEFGEWLEKAQ